MHRTISTLVIIPRMVPEICPSMKKGKFVIFMLYLQFHDQMFDIVWIFLQCLWLQYTRQFQFWLLHVCLLWFWKYAPVTLVGKKKGTSMSYVNVLPFINYALYSLQVMDQQDTLNIHLGNLDITSEDFWLDEVDGMHVQNLQDGGCCYK